jgi:hypothetical protein
MRLLPRLFAVVAACGIFPAAHAACTAATIKGAYSVTISGWYSGYAPMSGVGHATLDGIKTVTLSTYRESMSGTIVSYTGTGTYTLDAYCRGWATITLKQNGVAAGTLSMPFTVAGTPALPSITGVVSNSANEFSGNATLNKIGI